MLLVPYSSIIEMMFWRMPVRIDATTIEAITPMTMPSTVRKLRNLFERTLSSAIRRVSRGKMLGTFSFIWNKIATEAQRHGEKTYEESTKWFLADHFSVSLCL